MTDGTVHLRLTGDRATVTFDRPAAHNAMTWKMYDELATICRQLADHEGLRAVMFRGTGGKAFVAGTDIAQFDTFESGDDGIRYEAMIDEYVALVETLPMLTIALVEGYAVGGGLALAAACDVRLATPDAKFSVPIARTLGNCLSMSNMRRLVHAIGASRTKRMLMLAESLSAQHALDAGFVLDIVSREDMDTQANALCDRVAQYAPLTLKAAKESVRRIVHLDGDNADDLVRLCYGSEDFRNGVKAFTTKTPARWQGR